MSEVETIVITATGDSQPHRWLLKMDSEVINDSIKVSGDTIAVTIPVGDHVLIFQIDAINPFKGTANAGGKKLSFITDRETGYELAFSYEGPLKKKGVVLLSEP